VISDAPFWSYARQLQVLEVTPVIAPLILSPLHSDLPRHFFPAAPFPFPSSITLLPSVPSPPLPRLPNCPNHCHFPLTRFSPLSPPHPPQKFTLPLAPPAFSVLHFPSVSPHFSPSFPLLFPFFILLSRFSPSFSPPLPRPLLSFFLPPPPALPPFPVFSQSPLTRLPLPNLPSSSHPRRLFFLFSPAIHLLLLPPSLLPFVSLFAHSCCPPPPLPLHTCPCSSSLLSCTLILSVSLPSSPHTAFSTSKVPFSLPLPPPSSFPPPSSLLPLPSPPFPHSSPTSLSLASTPFCSPLFPLTPLSPAFPTSPLLSSALRPREVCPPCFPVGRTLPYSSVPPTTPHPLFLSEVLFSFPLSSVLSRGTPLFLRCRLSRVFRLRQLEPLGLFPPPSVAASGRETMGFLAPFFFLTPIDSAICLSFLIVFVFFLR